MIRIFAKVGEDIEAKLVLVGDGDERPAALSLAAELGLKDKVVFLGKQDNVEELIPCADVLLLPSADESFGLVALEAMSCGVPVVGSRTGGLPEVVADGVCGFLHPVGDVDAMASSALALLEDRELMARFRLAGRQRALDHFDERAIIVQYEDYYKKILKDK